MAKAGQGDLDVCHGWTFTSKMEIKNILEKKIFDSGFEIYKLNNT